MKETLHDKIKRKVDTKQLSISEISRHLGITRPTVYARLKNADWKRSEFDALKRL